MNFGILPQYFKHWNTITLWLLERFWTIYNLQNSSLNVWNPNNRKEKGWRLYVRPFWTRLCLRRLHFTESSTVTLPENERVIRGVGWNWLTSWNRGMVAAESSKPWPSPAEIRKVARNEAYGMTQCKQVEREGRNRGRSCILAFNTPISLCAEI